MAPLEGYRFGAAVAEIRMRGNLTDGNAVAPAAFAFGGGGFGDGRAVGFAGYELELAEDEKFLQFGKAG